MVGIVVPIGRFLVYMQVYRRSKAIGSNRLRRRWRLDVVSRGMDKTMHRYDIMITVQTPEHVSMTQVYDAAQGAVQHVEARFHIVDCGVAHAGTAKITEATALSAVYGLLSHLSDEERAELARALEITK